MIPIHKQEIEAAIKKLPKGFHPPHGRQYGVLVTTITNALYPNPETNFKTFLFVYDGSSRDWILESVEYV